MRAALVVLSFFGVVCAFAQGPSTFSAINNNILQPKCASCHGDGDQPNFSSYNTVMKVVVAGSPEKSPLFIQVNSNRMPMGDDPLSADEKAAIKSWIADGARNN